MARYLDNEILDGSVFEGTYVEGRKVYGTFTSTKGTYIGQFLDGYFHGNGKLISINGDQYEGEFAQNKKNGTGTHSR